MSTNNIIKSDLDNIFNVVQNSMILFPKEIVLATLKDFFSQDTYYHYVRDKWGFAKITDHTNEPLDDGLNNDQTSRILISQAYRQDQIFYPSIIVKHSGSNYVPISMNRETATVSYDYMDVQDVHTGQVKQFKYPKYYVFAGAWEGSLSIDISTKSLDSRDELVEKVALLFTDIAFPALSKSGLVIKSVQVTSPSESDERNDKIYKQSVNLGIRSEWRREIPISNLIEIISATIEFGVVGDSNYPISPNLTIKTDQTLTDFLLNL